MTPALAASSVVAIFVVFLVLHAAIGTRTNTDEIGSLRWDVEYDVQAEIRSLQFEIESLGEDVEEHVQTKLGSFQFEIESLRRDVEDDVQSEIGSLQFDIESLRRDIQYIQSIIDR